MQQNQAYSEKSVRLLYKSDISKKQQLYIYRLSHYNGTCHDQIREQKYTSLEVHCQDRDSTMTGCIFHISNTRARSIAVLGRK